MNQERSLAPRIDRQCSGPAEIRGICTGCDENFVRLIDRWKDARDVRGAIRQHVAETGHTVSVEVISLEAYRVG